MGTGMSSLKAPVENEVVPRRMDLAQSASRILHDAAVLIFQTGFAEESDYQSTSLTFVQESCGGITMTLLFAQNGSS
jgi:hypothetical protein